MAGKEGKATIVIRKEEVVEGGHHGGAWKVAYADFVTAMMAFFLLMWLLNATTEQQRRGLADYFSPTNAINRGASGYGMPFGGRTPNSDGSMASDRGAVQVGRPAPPITSLDDEPDDAAPGPPQPRQAQTDQAQTDGGGPQPNERSADLGIDPPRVPGESARAGTRPNPPTQARTAAPTDKDIQAELDRRERAAFESAAQQIRDAVRADPSLADLARQLMIDITPEGLRVQLVDEDRQPMFATGSAALNDRARAVLAKIAPVLMRLPQRVSIAGHTDSAPYRGSDKSNWDLSADRANATRKLLIEAGLQEGRVRSVSGMADRDLLVPKDGLAAANRRIAITVLHDPAAGAR